MKFLYYAIFEKDGDGFWLHFPDLPGCHTCGKNYEHARKMAKEALDLYLHDMKIDMIPKQTHIKNIKLNDNQKLVMITTDLPLKDNKVFCADVKMINHKKLF